jgi:hypothetical protein
VHLDVQHIGLRILGAIKLAITRPVILMVVTVQERAVDTAVI